MKKDLLKYILENGKLEPNKLGITEVYIDDDESIVFGSKNNKTVLTVNNLSIDDIEQEIEDSKFFLKLSRSELPQFIKDYESVKHLGSPKFVQQVKDVKEMLYYAQRSIYVNKFIAIPYFQYHLRVKSEKIEFTDKKLKLAKAKLLLAKARLKFALI